MKRIYLVLALLVATLLPVLAQQITVNVTVPPPYSPYLLDYAAVPGRMTLQVRNNTRNTLQIKLLASVSGDNGISIRTKPEYRPAQALVLAPNETRLFRTPAELRGYFERDNIDIQGISEYIYKSRTFPEGSYNICFRAVDYLTNAPYSLDEPLGCSNPINVRFVEPPVLISPVCDDTLRMQIPQAVVFSWAAAVGTPVGINYALKLVELPDVEVNPNAYMDAVQVPFFEQRNLRQTSLVYQAAMPPLRPGKTYAMRITALDPQRRVHFLNDGHSPVCTFVYTTQKP
jgi:hypothetical protein